MRGCSNMMCGVIHTLMRLPRHAKHEADGLPRWIMVIDVQKWCGGSLLQPLKPTILSVLVHDSLPSYMRNIPDDAK
jgi:hypothetical protein